MEDFNEYSERKKLAFVSFCVEEYEAKMGCSDQKVIDFFNRYGVIEYLLEHYEVLHSMGARAILEEIEIFICNRRTKVVF